MTAIICRRIAVGLIVLLKSTTGALGATKIPWKYGAGGGSNPFSAGGLSGGSYLTGGGIGSLGSAYASGAGSNLHALDEFVTGPFISSPKGAALTGTSSLQRAFPERFGGNFMQPVAGQPSVLQQAASLPANIAETPVAIANVATGGGLGGFLKAIGDHTPIGGLVDAAGGAIQRTFSLPAALMNAAPAETIGKTWNLPDDTPLSAEELAKAGVNPTWAIQFRKNGLPILGWLGVTGDQMTVGDLKKELAGRGFNVDEQGQQMDWADVAAKAAGPFGTYQFGDKAVNENPVSDFALQTGGQAAEILLGGEAFGAVKAIGMGVRGVDELASAGKIADGLNGAGQIAKMTGKVQTFGDWAKNPVGKIAGGWGEGAVSDLSGEGVKAIAAQTIAPTAAAEAIGAGDVTAASLKGAAQYWLKQALLPGKGSLLTRYYLGQTRIRAALFGTEQLTGALESYGIHLGPVTALHDFTQSVLNDHTLSDNAAFQAATAFTFPVHAALKDISTPVRKVAGEVMGSAGNLRVARTMFLKEFGADAIQKLGGDREFGAWMDRMRQSIAADHMLNIMGSGVRQKYESIPEAVQRLGLLGQATRATASFLERSGKITANDLVERFRDIHENPIGTKIADDGTRTRGPILPYRTKLSNDVILQRAADYSAAESRFSDPFFGTQTAVLGRASRMTQEDLDTAVAAAQSAASLGDGTLDAQFVRDLFYQTPGMLDDPFLTEQAHSFAVEAMNPAVNKVYTADEVVGLLKNLKDVSPTRDELWHDLTARDAATPVDPGQNGVPGGPVQNGVLRQIHSKETLRRWRVDADARVRVLTQERNDVLAQYKAEFSKRGRVKSGAADFNWDANGQAATDLTSANGGGTFNARTGKPRTYKDGYQVGGHNGTFATVTAGDTEGLKAASRAIRAEYPGADVGTWLDPDTGLIDVDPSFYIKDKAAALQRAAELNQKEIWDHANSTGITVPNSKPTAAEPSVHFSADTEAAAATRREIFRQQINEKNSALRNLKQDLRDYNARAEELRTINMDASFYTPDGMPRVHPREAQALADLVAHTRENYPQWEVEAGPRLMNKYEPDENYLKNLMIEHSALGQRLFDWGPVSKMTSAIETIFRPVKGSREAKDTISRLYEVMMKLGAKQTEVDAFLRNVNDVLLEGPSFGVGPERIPVTRGIQGMTANQLTRQAVKAMGSNDALIANFQKRYGGKGLARMYVPLVEAYNPAVRATQREIEQGGKPGALSRLFASGYDKYHIGPTSGMAASTRMLAKFIYPNLRFTSNPLYHIYNLTEADIIGITQDGLKVTRGSANPALSREVFDTLERGNPQAMASLREAQRRMTSLGAKVDLGAAGSDAIRGATMDQTGVTFGLNTRRAKIIEGQMDVRRPQTIIDTLESFAKDDPAMQAAMKRFGGDSKSWVNELASDIYGIDKEGAAGVVSKLVRKQGWSDYEMQQMQPLVTEIQNRMQQTFDDLYQVHVGNVNRNRMERVLNSYWLYWPASYMLKASKWMVGVLTDKAFGAKTNLGGAWTLNQLADAYHARYQQDPHFKKLVDDNKDLEFMLSQILPVAPWSDGVSLNRMTRYVGGAVGLWPDYSNFDASDVKSWAGKMSDIGPAYSLPLMLQVAGDLGKDFNISLQAPKKQLTQLLGEATTKGFNE